MGIVFDASFEETESLIGWSGCCYWNSKETCNIKELVSLINLINSLSSTQEEKQLENEMVYI